MSDDRIVPTASAVWNVSRWNQAKYGTEGGLYSTLRAELDRVNYKKPNNVQDALIAETAMLGGYILVTDDSDLESTTTKYGGSCLSLKELQEGG